MRKCVVANNQNRENNQQFSPAEAANSLFHLFAARAPLVFSLYFSLHSNVHVIFTNKDPFV